MFPAASIAICPDPPFVPPEGKNVAAYCGPAVVKVELNALAIAPPPELVTPLTVTVYLLLVASGADGVKVATYVVEL
jgi:hypothetical protein